MPPSPSADLFGFVTHDPGGKSKPRWPAGSVVSARFSECGRYRWSLHEVWDPSLPRAMFLLMSPSVAGVSRADPTLIRTGAFARGWGYGAQMVANVHAYRATDPQGLLAAEDPVGAENGSVILPMACDAALVVLAYGKPPPRFRPRSLAVVGLLRAAGVRLTYLRASLDGTPQHPLYLPASVIPLDFQPPSSDPGLNRCHEADRQMVQDAMLSKVVSSASSMPAPTA